MEAASVMEGRGPMGVGTIIGLFIVGIVAGYLGRLLVPGRDPLGFFGTALLGIVGSFIGGFLGWMIFGSDAQEGAFQVSGLLGSIVGAVIAVLLWRAMGGRQKRRVLRH